MLEFEQTEQPPPGYVLSGPDNNTRMYDRHAEWDACPGCGSIDRSHEINPDFTLEAKSGELIDYGIGQVESPASHTDAKRVFDCSSTYDSWLIVSVAFRDVVVQSASTTVEFDALPREPRFFALRPTAVVEVDTERSNITFEPTCEVCGKSTGAHGSIRYLRHPDVLDPFGMYCTDVELGDVNSMRPDVLAGPQLAHLLRPLNGVILYHALRR